MTMSNVLVTGGTGYIASHIIDQLLKEGKYQITATTRDLERAQRLSDHFLHYQNNVKFVCVKDQTHPQAFQTLFQQAHAAGKPFEYVIHTAPCRPGVVHDIVKDYVEPASTAVTLLLDAAAKYGGELFKRVVFTGSAHAMKDPFLPLNLPRRYNESTWCPITLDQVVSTQSHNLAHKLSETLAEQTALTYMRDNRLNFDLVLLVPVVTLGPNLKPVLKREDVEAGAVERIYEFMDRTYQSLEGIVPKAYRFVDVRDVARAHVESLTNPQAGGMRIVLAAPDVMSPQSVVNNINKNFPELKERVAKGDSDRIVPEGVVPEVVESRVNEIFGWEFRSLEDSVVDFVRQVLEQEEEWK